MHTLKLFCGILCTLSQFFCLLLFLHFWFKQYFVVVVVREQFFADSSIMYKSLPSILRQNIWGIYIFRILYLFSVINRSYIHLGVPCLGYLVYPAQDMRRHDIVECSKSSFAPANNFFIYLFFPITAIYYV